MLLVAKSLHLVRNCIPFSQMLMDIFQVLVDVFEMFVGVWSNIAMEVSSLGVANSCCTDIRFHQRGYIILVMHERLYVEF